MGGGGGGSGILTPLFHTFVFFRSLLVRQVLPFFCRQRLLYSFEFPKTGTEMGWFFHQTNFPHFPCISCSSDFLRFAYYSMYTRADCPQPGLLDAIVNTFISRS